MKFRYLLEVDFCHNFLLYVKSRPRISASTEDYLSASEALLHP